MVKNKEYSMYTKCLHFIREVNPLFISFLKNRNTSSLCRAKNYKRNNTDKRSKHQPIENEIGRMSHWFSSLDFKTTCKWITTTKKTYPKRKSDCTEPWLTPIYNNSLVTKPHRQAHLAAIAAMLDSLLARLQNSSYLQR